jgi:glycosyltransferase involved in cell wall biosynthesis
MHALLGQRLLQCEAKRVPITIGFYHYIKYLWGGNDVAYYERLNREFVFEYLPKKSLMMFSEDNKRLYSKHKNMDFSEANSFSIGVFDQKDFEISGEVSRPLKIVAVGRLVEFKTYNFYMLDVVRNLIDRGISVIFDIYGDGPLKKQIQEKIIEKNVDSLVSLKGTLDYSKFDETVASYDMFIGNGTAITQAASLGIPSVVGPENMQIPKTFGYFSNLYKRQYSRNDLDLPLFNVEDLIADYTFMSKEERFNLKLEHANCSRQFTNKSCQQSMDSLKNIEMPEQPFEFNRWVYEFSRVADRINMKINRNHPFIKRHKDFNKNELP